MCPCQVLIYVKVRAEFAADKNASGLELVCPMPPEVQRVACDYEREPKPPQVQSWDWQERAHRLVWKFKRVQGGTEHTLKVRAQPSVQTLRTTQLMHCVLSCAAVQGRLGALQEKSLLASLSQSFRRHDNGKRSCDVQMRQL